MDYSPCYFNFRRVSYPDEKYTFSMLTSIRAEIIKYVTVEETVTFTKNRHMFVNMATWSV